MSTRIRRGLLVIGLLVFFFFAYITAIKLAFVMLYFAVLLAAVSWLWTRLGTARLSIVRDAPAGAYEVGEDFVEVLTVSNPSIVSLPWVEVVDGSAIRDYDAGRAVNVGRQGERSWRTQGRFVSRGRYQMGPTRLVAGDPFGLFERTVLVPATSSVTVYPRLVDVSRFLPGASHTLGDTIAMGRYVDAPPDASGIREYDPADGFNRIHWPSTARLGRPMSKSFEKYEGSDLIMVLDLRSSVHRGRPPKSTLEYAVSLAASLALLGLGRNQSVGLACNDARHTTFLPARGVKHLRRILDFLSEVDADGGVSLDSLLQGLAASRGRQSLVVITPSLAGAWVDWLSRVGLGGSRSNAVLHLDASSFGGEAGSAAGPRSLGEQTAWWQLTADDEIFRHRPAAGRAGRDPLAPATLALAT
jgi:uncharacterized protein (DUF58 family)